ncbi:MAG: FAD-dependent oxidoreductase [Gammaproteobacteria bacterium]|nr:FAD-dependent oxidoreductase [Gammaproteobacteria bacterium]
MSSHHITVIGSGFAALASVRELRKRDPEAHITVIAPRAEFVYLPSLIWIPSGLRQPDELRIPLDNFFARMRVEFIAAEVTGLREGGRTVETTAGEVANDALIIASGGRFIKKLPGIEHAITPCEGVESALKIRERLKAMSGGTIAIGFAGNPQEPSAMRGGPMFEFLFGIDTLLRQQGRRDKFKLVFFSPAAEPGKRLGPKAMTGLLDTMRRRGIETRLGHKMKAFESNKVITEGGEFAADLILFMPGMTGNLWFDNSELPRSAGGLLQADAQCCVPGFAHLYVAGDSGSFPGPEWMPKQAHMAELQAKAAVANLLDELAGGEAKASFRVELMCIVDSLDRGMFVARTTQRAIVLPPLRIAHWAKRIFEWWFLRQLR